jgi:sulfate adenylyltransferase
MSLKPHGGRLEERMVSGEARTDLIRRSREWKKVRLDQWERSDAYLISTGAFSPLKGFMGRADYEGAVKEMRLENGLLWSIPVTLAVDKDESKGLKEGDEVGLVDEGGELIAVLSLEEKFEFHREKEAKSVYKTDDREHPGVKRLHGMGDVLLGGPIQYVQEDTWTHFPQYSLTPAQTRDLFEKKGWRTVVAFQTRNPVHRAHEYLQKCAMEMVDGLLLHPIVGETKSDDIPADVRMRCYEILLENYYPKDRVALVILPMAMRYAGPREAIHHAIVRKNYGCTHIIIGRDHAGVGSYYGTYDAQRIFDTVDGAELEIQPIFFDHAFFCKRCGQMVSQKTCPHDSENHVFLSGTKVREMLRRGEYPPAEFTRPEVAEVLIQSTGGGRR